MIEYHKIQSVYMRDPATKHRTFITGEWAMPEFGYLANNEWIWTEKVDGTNIRVRSYADRVEFGGRTDDAQIPTFLLSRLQSMFQAELFREKLPEVGEIILFGEGYGAKIQKGGGNYKADGCDFVLFDVMVGGMYLERANVEDIADKLGIRAVPIVGKGTLAEGIEATKAGLLSTWGTFKAEGLVMRTAVELVTRRGARIITKVKTRDFL